MANNFSTDLESSSSQYWSISDGSQSGLDITGAMTIALWVKFESTTPDATVWPFVSKLSQSGNQQSYMFSYRDDGTPRGLYYRLSSDGTNTNTSSGLESWEPVNGTWYHIGMTYDPALSADSMYFNPSMDSQTTVA